MVEVPIKNASTVRDKIPINQIFYRTGIFLTIFAVLNVKITRLVNGPLLKFSFHNTFTVTLICENVEKTIVVLLILDQILKYFF